MQYCILACVDGGQVSLHQELLEDGDEGRQLGELQLEGLDDLGGLGARHVVEADVHLDPRHGVVVSHYRHHRAVDNLDGVVCGQGEEDVLEGLEGEGGPPPEDDEVQVAGGEVEARGEAAEGVDPAAGPHSSHGRLEPVEHGQPRAVGVLGGRHAPEHIIHNTQTYNDAGHL